MEKYAGKETAAYRRDLERLKNGEHIDYVIGFSDFLGLKVDLKKRPLIPRPETEHWVERSIEDIRRGRTAGAKRVLDLFCGSGCVGLAVLAHLPEAKVDFADIESAYFPGIRKSLAYNHLISKRAGFRRSDVFKNIKSSYDYIFANPPYIPTKGRKVQRSVLLEEPHAALFGGKDGLKFIRSILKEGQGHLAKGGTLIFEFDPPQKVAIAKLAKQYGWTIEFNKDQYKRWRWAALKPALDKASDRKRKILRKAEDLSDYDGLTRNPWLTSQVGGLSVSPRAHKHIVLPDN